MSLEFRAEIDATDLRYKEQMRMLKERVLLYQLMKYVVVPCIILAIFGTFFPFIQALLPIQESDTCTCIYFYEKANDLNEYEKRYPIFGLIDNSQVALALMQIFSNFSFFAINFIFLAGNIYAVFKVRHMNDTLMIKWEMTLVVAAWSIFDFIQYIFFCIV